MAKRRKYNPERRAWRGRSYRKGGMCVKDLKYKILKTEY